MVSVTPIRTLPLSSFSLSDAMRAAVGRLSPAKDSPEEILRMATLTKALVHFSTPLIRSQGHFSDESGKGSGLISIAVEDAELSISAGSKMTVLFELFRELHAFETVVEEVSKNQVRLKSPESISRVHQRILDRFALATNDHIPVMLREVSGRRFLSGEVVDLSSKGLGVVVPAGDEALFARLMQLDRDVVLEPRIPSLKNAVPVPAKIVHWDRRSQTLRLGISCRLPLALGDEQSLEDFLLERKYPNVIRAKTDEDYKEVWRLLNLSFQTIDAAPEESRRDSSIITWKKTSWSSRPINRIYVLQKPTDDGQAVEKVGTIATSRYYHKTWLIHQLGVDGTKGQVLSHQLYGRVVDYLRQTDEVKYVFGTFPKESHVFQKYYIDFIRNDPESHFHYLEETNILEFDVSSACKDLGQGADSAVRVVPFETRHQAAVMGELRKRYSDLFLSAMDLREFDLELTDTSALYSRVALQRERRIVVAERDSKVVGFAIAEWGSEDQNVFSLFDNFRLFVVEEGADLMPVKRALLRNVFELFRENGVRVAISWTKDKSLLELVPSGKIFYEVYFWIADHSRMRPFLRHLDRLHGRVQAVRGSRKSRFRPASSLDQ